jgi:predicted CopG family antitoxin
MDKSPSKPRVSFCDHLDIRIIPRMGKCKPLPPRQLQKKREHSIQNCTNRNPTLRRMPSKTLTIQDNATTKLQNDLIQQQPSFRQEILERVKSCLSRHWLHFLPNSREIAKLKRAKKESSSSVSAWCRKLQEKKNIP